MKKNLMLVLLLLSGSLPILCMDAPQAMKVDESSSMQEQSGLSALPAELKLHILSFIAGADSLTRLLNNLAILSLVNSEFNQLAHDELFRRQVIKIYLNSRGEKQLRQDFFKAAIAGNLREIKALVEAGININMQTTEEDFLTPEFSFILESSSSPKEIAKLAQEELYHRLTHRALGYTALCLAAEKGNKEIVAFLLDNGADHALRTRIPSSDAYTLACYRRSHVEEFEVGFFFTWESTKQKISDYKEIEKLLEQKAVESALLEAREAEERFKLQGAKMMNLLRQMYSTRT